jgi:hemerythrin-like domain-containing protein
MENSSPIVQGLNMIHKIITRGINISLKKCEEYVGTNGIPQGEAAGFFLYVSALKWVTHAHHLSEDEIAFPYFRKLIEGPFDQLKEDHQKIAGLLDRLDEPLSEKSFSATGKLMEVLAAIKKIWIPHIKVEEDNFTADKVSTALGKEKQDELLEKLSQHGRANAGPGPLTLPFMCYNLVGDDRKSFTKPFPWILRKVFIPVIWKRQWKSMSPFFL